MVRLDTGEVQRAVVYAVKRMNTEKDDEKVMMRLWRGQWGIEKRMHWMRDVGLSEDRYDARVDGVTKMMDACRNNAIGIMRAHGHDNINDNRRDLEHKLFADLNISVSRRVMGLPAARYAA